MNIESILTVLADCNNSKQTNKESGILIFHKIPNKRLRYYTRYQTKVGLQRSEGRKFIDCSGSRKSSLNQGNHINYLTLNCSLVVTHCPVGAAQF